MSQEIQQYSSLPVARPWYEPYEIEEAATPSLLDIAESYRTQWYRLSANGRHVALRPRSAEHNDLWSRGGRTPRLLAGLAGQHIITWAHVPGTLSTTEARQVRKERLLKLADQLSVAWTPIALFADRSQWLEPAALVTCSWEQARQLAEVNRQVAIGQFVVSGVYWWHSLAGTYFTEDSESFTPLLESSWLNAPCPMSRRPETNLPVKREGGPGTSRGHAVAAMWSAHSSWAHSLVDCEVHSGRRPIHRERGRAIPLSEVTPASRFGPIRFVRSPR